MDTHTASGLAEAETINTTTYAPQVKNPFAGDAPLTPDTLSAAMNSARTAFTSSEDRAADAAAQAFCIWYWCCSAVAPSDMKAAYDEGVKKRNEQITEINDGIKAQKKVVKTASEAFAKTTKETIATTNDPDVIAQLTAKIKADEEQCREKHNELRTTRLVMIKERNKTVPFVEAVKYALDLTKQTQASQVNRYASALGWIHKKVFDNGKLITTNTPNAADIAAKIKKVGGVKGAADAYRAEQADGEAAEDRAITTEAINAKLMEALHNMTPLATTQVSMGTKQDEFVLLFAHKQGTNVELLTKLDMSSEEATKMAASHTTANVLKSNPEAEFLGETLDAANQISKPIFFFDAERAPEQLVVTFKEMQDGAPILHAKPKLTAAATFMPTKGAMLLDENTLNQLAKRLGTPHQRKLISVGVSAVPGMTASKAPTPSPFAWETTNSALASKNRAAAVEAHEWTNADYVQERPHDVIDNQPNLAVSITATDIQSLLNGPLKAWAEDKSATKANNVMKLTFSANDLTVAGEKNADKVPVTLIGAPPKQPCQVTLHPKTLVETFKMLLDTSAQTFELMPDNHGVVKIHWETGFGIYDLYLPLCRKGRKFETRLIAPIR